MTGTQSINVINRERRRNGSDYDTMIVLELTSKHVTSYTLSRRLGTRLKTFVHRSTVQKSLQRLKEAGLAEFTPGLGWVLAGSQHGKQDNA